MTPERWREIGGIVDAALELPRDRRAAYVATSCPNAEVRAEVERLLGACERSDGFLDEPAGGFAAPLLDARAGPTPRDAAGMLRRLRTGLAERYAIERELGHGGMAIVYLAHDVRHRREVAVKVLRPELAAALGAQRFLREIETLARLAHPHILPLLDSGEVDGLLYYVMPYVEGESLRVRLDRELQLPVDEALRIASEVAGALDYAHRHNVLHRDLKPENILLADGQAVVADFGIARAITRAASDTPEGITGDTLTATGLSLGTPTYMSPEQAAGDRTLDGRSDVYALGCMLFEMLAGQAPFTGPTAESVIRQHMLMPPPDLAAVRQGVPASLLMAVSRALAKAPADRFATMAEFARALDPTTPRTRDAWTAASAARGARGAWARTIGLVVLSVLLAIAVAWAMWQLRGGTSSAGGNVPRVEHARQLTFDPELELDPALSPDGRFVAYAAGPIHDTKIYVRQVSGGRSVLLSDTMSGALRWPRWSPDGSRISFHSGTGIYVVSALGGPVRRVVESPHGRSGMPPIHSATWSPDGTALAYAADSSIWEVRIADGLQRRITHAFRANALAWSPDGSMLAYASGNPQFTLGAPFIGNIAPAAIFVVESSGGVARRITQADAFATSPAWTPDGRGLLFISDLAGGRDVYSLRLRRDGSASEPQRLTTGLQAHSISLGRDGRQLAYATFTKVANIFSVAVDPTRPATLANARPVTRGSQTIEGLSLSRDGRWLAFDSNLSGNQDIYRMPSSGGEAERLTDAAGDDFLPAWSPDGREIVYFSLQEGSRDVMLMRSDGSGSRRLTHDSGQESYPDWSPDGQQIVYQSSGILEIIARGSSGAFGVPRRVVARGAFARWSPTGDWIVYLERGVGLFLVSPHGTNRRALLEDSLAVGGLRAEWSRDGRRIYYQGLEPTGSWSIRVMPIDGGAAQTLLHVDDPARPFSDNFATDDRRLFFTVTDFSADLWMLTLGQD